MVYMRSLHTVHSITHRYIDALRVLGVDDKEAVVSEFLPFESSMIGGCVDKFDEMAEEVRQQLPTVLLNIMRILSEQ